MVGDDPNSCQNDVGMDGMGLFEHARLVSTAFASAS